MRRAQIISFLIFAAVSAAILGHAFAQSPPAPGSGHGFLIDKHTAAGLNCASCHAESPPSKAPDNSACMKCHGSYADVAAKTAQDQPNPHASHLGQILHQLPSCSSSVADLLFAVPQLRYEYALSYTRSSEPQTTRKGEEV